MRESAILLSGSRRLRNGFVTYLTAMPVRLSTSLQGLQVRAKAKVIHPSGAQIAADAADLLNGAVQIVDTLILAAGGA